MPTIQIITEKGNEQNLAGKDIKLSKISNPDSFDFYNINIIFLDGIWFNNQDNKTNINCLCDLKNLKTIISKSYTSKIIIILPKNEKFNYYRSSTNNYYYHSSELKNMIPQMLQILSYLNRDLEYMSLFYENNITSIGEFSLQSNFCFDNVDDKDVLTKSDRSNKIITIRRNGIVYTNLHFENISQLITFLREIKLLEDKQTCPDWMRTIDMFDDANLKKTIKECEEIIQKQEKSIENSNLKLKKNDYYKSILYTQGQELVDVIHEICEEMFGFDLSSFKDIKKEDFLYEGDYYSYIGEIKGVTSNVKSANVSQLDVHYQEYIENNPNKEDKTIALLIMNHQRNKPINIREPIHENQIKLAIRNGSLIIDTYTLLKMFEKYKSGKLTREKVLEIIHTKKGILLDTDF